MRPSHFVMQVALAFTLPPNMVSASCGFGLETDTPLPTGLFSAAFNPPSPPTVSTELVSSFIQHKYDANVSHITSGYWYNSATAAKVRVDEAYAGTLASSLFDYADVDQTGAVRNRFWSVSGSLGSPPQCFDDYVTNPGFALLTEDLLVASDASFGGVVEDPWIGRAESWNLLYAGSIPVIAYLQNTTVVVGYDFWSPFGRTKVLTRFFNVEVGMVDPVVFQNFPCGNSSASVRGSRG